MKKILDDKIIVEPNNKEVDAVVIWLHGLGADGYDFVDIIPDLGLPNDHKIKFIFPHAPFRDITINAGMNMRAWYDIYHNNLNAKEDSAGIKNSEQFLIDLVRNETEQGIASNRVILAGFSQGGAIALYTGLRANFQLGGIIALSTYQVLANSLAAERSDINQNMSIFMAHGLTDPIVPYSIAYNNYQQMLNLKYPIQWHEYNMQHTVVLEEIKAIGDFITQLLYH